MSRVAALSLFRDSSQQYIDQYFDRASSISGNHDIDFFLVEGDSKNNTFGMLEAKAKGDERFKALKNDTGLPQMGSVVHDIRFRCLTRTANPTIDAIAEMDYDYFWFIDSDLLYPPTIVSSMIRAEKDVVAPIIMAGPAFYDLWAFRGMNGIGIGPHTDWIKDSRPVELSSVGGCVMIDHDFIRLGARMTETESIVGLCKECSELGASIWMDTTSVVFHPGGTGDDTFESNLERYGSPAKNAVYFEFNPTDEVIAGALHALSLLDHDAAWGDTIKSRIKSKKPDVRTVLYGLAKSIKPRRYLEIGVRRGHSMAMVFHAHPECNVVGFDAWIEGYGGIENPGPDFVREQMELVGHTGTLKLVSGRTSETLKSKARGKFDIILVDGDHSSEGTAADVKICLKRMSDRCVLVIDDLHAEAVRAAWEQIKCMIPAGFEAVELSSEVGIIKPTH